MKWRQTPYWGATNFSRHCNKTSQHGDQMPTICSPLDVNNKEKFCSHFTVNTAGVQYKQWLHNVVSRNNRCFLCEAYEMHTFTVWQNAEIVILKYSKIPLIRLARGRTGAEYKNAGLSDCTCTNLSSKRHFFLLILHLRCKTRQRNIPSGYRLHHLVQGKRGPLLCFLQPS